jgi:hypothetical protein
VPLDALTELPLGSIVDARKGRVRITAEVDPKTGKTQSAVFYGGRFSLVQPGGAGRVAEARLVRGSPGVCDGTADDHSVQARLWGVGASSFRIRGRRSTTTARGAATWLVEDRCDGTLTRVKIGRVDVRDFRLKKTSRLRPGRSYLAKAP